MITKRIIISHNSIDEVISVYDQPNFGYAILRPFYPGTFSISVDGGAYVGITAPVTSIQENSSIVLMTGGYHGTVRIPVRGNTEVNIAIFETLADRLSYTTANPIGTVCADIYVSGVPARPIEAYQLITNGGYSFTQHETDMFTVFRLPFRFDAMKIVRRAEETGSGFHLFIFPVYNNDMVMPDFYDPPFFAVFDMRFVNPDYTVINRYFNMSEGVGTTAWRNMNIDEWPGTWRVKSDVGHAFDPAGREVACSGIGRRMTLNPTPGSPIYGNGYNSIACMPHNIPPAPSGPHVAHAPLASIILFYTYRNSLSALA